MIVGDWHVNADRNVIKFVRGDEEMRLEPKVMQLLSLLVASYPAVVDRESIRAALWPTTIVTEDALARTVSRLRSALGDDSSRPRYIETVPKRGYRLIIEPVAAPKAATGANSLVKSYALVATSLLVLALVAFLLLGDRGSLNTSDSYSTTLQRAEDFYMQFTQRGNEAAIELYRSVLADDPHNARAQAGLANALIQRVIRWPSMARLGKPPHTTLGAALQSGTLENAEVSRVLQRAVDLAERASRRVPNDTVAIKALAFAYSGMGRLDEAETLYKKAISIHPGAWRSLINLGEIYTLQEKDERALSTFKQAYAAMNEQYASEPQYVGPWMPAVGIVVAQMEREKGDTMTAEQWYRKVLSLAPLEPIATAELASLLRSGGQIGEAEELCRQLNRRTGIDQCGEED